MASLACYLIPSLLSALIAAAHLFEAGNPDTSLQHYAAVPDHAPPRLHSYPHHAAHRADELQLLDTVILASIDGRFHALNRTTGKLVWSMEQNSLSNQAVKLPELVRTEHPGLRRTAFDPEVDEDELPETYIIEPQSGAIFVNAADAKREDPLQRLPFSMAQLVEMSPFQMEQRTFVGKKKTSLITIDLNTGQVMDILDPEQCGWEDRPISLFASRGASRAEELLDEIDDEPVPARTLIHIGRTGGY